MRSWGLTVGCLSLVLAAALCGCESQDRVAADLDAARVRQNPNHFQTGLDYEAQEKFREAEKEYQIAVKDNPTDSRALVNLGRLYDREGQTRRAETCWRRAVEVNPDDAIAYNLLGGIYMRQQDYNQAIVFYEKAVAANPKYANAHWNIAAAYRSLGMNQAAARHYRNYIELAAPQGSGDLKEAKQFVEEFEKK